MPARRRHPAATVALATALSVGAVLLVSACGPDEVTAASPAGSSTPGAPGSAQAPASRPPASKGTGKPSAAPASATPAGSGPNGTVHSPLTVSTGTSQVLMNGTSVDFHTVVRDLAWSPSGQQAAFINGSGDLVVSAPDGSGQRVLAKNPGGQTWSHPTWEQVKADPNVGMTRSWSNIIFAADQGGTTRLESVPSDGTNATPTPLSLNAELTDPPTVLPQTGNIWPSAQGRAGTSVYANSADGKVYIRDDYLRQQGGELTQGSEPALDTDASEVVFVRSTGGHDHLFTQRLDQANATAKDLTPNATTDYTEPAISPDGKTVAARTPAGIVTLPVDGSAAPQLTVTTPGLPAFRP